MQFIIDSARFIASSLSYLVNNPAEESHKIKCEYGHDNKKLKNVLGLNTKIASLEYASVMNDLIEYKCLPCHKNYQNFKKWFSHAQKFSNLNIDNFIL